MVDQVDRWLETLGLGKYAALLAENEITVEVLPDLTEADLKELGLPLGARKKIIRAASALNPPTGTDQRPGLAEAPAAAAQFMPAQAERRQLTVMFIDLVGSTALSAQLDPEEMGAVLRAYQNAVVSEIRRFDGHVAKFMGDGVLAYFGWPVAHEDEAERAVRAALAIIDAVSKLTATEGEHLACRIGLATGLVVVGELIGEGTAQEQTVVGETPNLAARLQELAEPCQAVISESTRRLLGAGFVLDDLGTQSLKGIDGSVSAFAVSAERELASRFEGRPAGLHPMVGRDQELALLLERWTQAKAGQGQAVLLLGEAGIGKSRITRALLDAMSPEPHTCLRYQCSPYHRDTALWPVVQQLSSAADFAAGESGEQRLAKLEALLGRAELARDDIALVAEVLAIDGCSRDGEQDLGPQARRARTLQALTRQMVGPSQRQPVLLLIEDAHWIDPTTLELVELCLDATATAPTMMVITSRPDHQPALANSSHVTRLSLNRLTRDGAEAIIDRVGGSRLPRATIETIIDRSDSVPLYVEELTKAVLEANPDSEFDPGTAPDRPFNQLVIPTSLHDALMARLDRLHAAKLVAQTAAVIGREFDHWSLVAISSVQGDELDAALERLAAAEVILCSGALPNVRYRFKHALLRDVAYESLLKSRRRALHAELALAFEQLSHEMAQAQPEILAHHLTQAGRLERAIPHWQIAGERAVQSSANFEAIAHFRRALRLVETLPPDKWTRLAELCLQTLLMGPLIATRGYWADEMIAACDRALELLRDDDESALQYAVIYGRIVAAVRREGLAKALKLAEEFVARAHAEGDAGPIAVARRLLGLFHLFVGNTDRARRELVCALSHCDSKQHETLTHQYGQNQRVSILTNLSITEWIGGFPQRAGDLIAEAIGEARRGGHDYTFAYTLTYGALQVHHCRRDAVAVAQTSRELADFAAGRGLTLCHSFAKIGVGWSLAHETGDGRAIELIKEGIAGLDASRTYHFRPFLLLLSAEAQLVQGSFGSALAALGDALAVGRERGDVWLYPELLRRRALVLADLGAPASEVEDGLFKAAETARHRAAYSFELRAGRDLATIWAEKRERQRAQDFLAAIYDRFTEGFDTPDLIEAKTLLDELR